MRDEEPILVGHEYYVDGTGDLRLAPEYRRITDRDERIARLVRSVEKTAKQRNR